MANTQLAGSLGVCTGIIYITLQTIGNRPIIVRFDMARVNNESLGEVGDRPVMCAFALAIGSPSAEVGFSIARIDIESLVIIGDRPVVYAFLYVVGTNLFAPLLRGCLGTPLVVS